MCFDALFGSKAKVDNSAAEQASREAAEARVREEQRQARVKDGMGRIDNAFASYTPEFYGQRRQAVLDLIMPQVEDQRGQAKAELQFALARAGLTNSAGGVARMAELERQAALARADAQSKAAAEESDFRGQVARERQTLESQLSASADPEATGNAATGISNVLNSKPVDAPQLGQLFATIAAGIGAYQNAQAVQEYRKGAQLFTPSNRPGGSTAVVR